MSGSVLVIDVGTSGVRGAVVRPDASVDCSHRVPLAAETPAPGLVELDARRLAEEVLSVAAVVQEEAGGVDGVAITNQRATTVVWERRTGAPVAPAIGWQDLRTVGTCLALQADGIRLAPNMSATKLAAILDAVDPERARADGLCFGTIDSWVAWTLSGGPGGPRGGLHVTDATNAAVTGLMDTSDLRHVDRYDTAVLAALRIPEVVLPRVVDTSGIVGEATALPGAPPICAMAGDQQASLVGQGCTHPKSAKATFGTGGMLDLLRGDAPPERAGRGPAGTFPIVAWRRGGAVVWGIEAMMLTAGSCVEWLRDDLGVVSTAEETAQLAASCETSGGVWFVPALMGLGTPVWDFGARGTLLGITRGTGRAELVRAVLEGVAHRGADLLESAEADGAVTVATLRVDGGMSANGVFVQALADACGRPVEVSRELEATTLGAGLLGGLAVGTWSGTDELAGTYRPKEVVGPRLDDVGRTAWRARWLEARDKAARTIPELSGIDF